MSLRVSGSRAGSNVFGMTLLIFLLVFIIVSFYPRFKEMRDGVYRLSCKEIRRKVEVAVADYDANNTKSIVNPGRPIDLDSLKAAGFLVQVQNCPSGERYVFGPQGEVLCPIHRPRVETPVTATGTSVLPPDKSSK